MIRHIVIFGIKETNDSTSIENAMMLKTELLKLVDLISELKRIEVGINAMNAPDNNQELCLTCDFDTIEDAALYQLHPEHIKVAKLIGEYKLSRACVDYEIN